MKMNHEIPAAHVAFTGRVLMVAALIVFSAVMLNAISTRNAEYQAKMKELVDNPQKKLITTVNGCGVYRIVTAEKNSNNSDLHQVTFNATICEKNDGK